MSSQCGNRRARLYDHGALVLRGTVEQVGRRLADLDVSTDDLIED